MNDIEIAIVIAIKTSLFNFPTVPYTPQYPTCIFQYHRNRMTSREYRDIQPLRTA